MNRDVNLFTLNRSDYQTRLFHYGSFSIGLNRAYHWKYFDIEKKNILFYTTVTLHFIFHDLGSNCM